MLKVLVFRSTAALLALAAALLISEVTVRFLAPQYDAILWVQPDPRYGYVQKPNFSQRFRFGSGKEEMHVSINSLGLRMAEIDPGALRDPGTIKILLLGDSFTFGHGVELEDHFATLLQELLERGEDGYLVINAGVSGWGTIQELRYGRDHLQLFQPSVVVLVFCGNDPEDDERFLARSAAGISAAPRFALLCHHSHLFRFMLAGRQRLAHNLRARAASGKGKVLDPQSASLISEAQWRRTSEAVEEFRCQYLSRFPSGRLLLLASDPLNDVIAANLSRWAQGPGSCHVYWAGSAAALPSSARRLSYDGHWSPEMHRAVASALAAAIQNQGATNAVDQSMQR